MYPHFYPHGYSHLNIISPYLVGYIFTFLGVKTPNICLKDKVVDLTVVFCLRGNQFFLMTKRGFL